MAYDPKVDTKRGVYVPWAVNYSKLGIVMASALHLA